VTFEESGLTFWHQPDDGPATRVHTVPVETLKAMTAAELDYCIATNVLIGLPSLQQLFAEYLWSQNGETPPSLERTQPRDQRGD
jgi:hypothetical protein